ncbi:MAG: YceI family protein [Bryobacter sp.]
MKLTLLSLLAFAAAFGQNYEIDAAHSAAAFTVKHMMVTNVSGKFGNLKGTVVVDEKNPANSKVDATIDVNSVNTNEAKRDGHLKSPDFFDAEKNPTMQFKSTKVYKAGKETKVEGNLTLHGVTKPVTLTITEFSPEVKHPMGGIVRGAIATTKLNRKDFGLTWNKNLDAGGVMISDEVNVTLEIEMKRS